MGKAITKDSVFDSMRRVEAALKLRYMGIGFVWAWLYCTYATSAVFPYRSGQSINSDESWLLSAVAVVLGFLVGGLLLSRRPLGGHCLRRFSIAAALLLAAGTIVSALGAFALGLAWLGGAMTGVGYALLSLLWARALMVLYLAIGWQAALADVRDSMHALIDLDVSMLISSLASVALGDRKSVV